MRASRAWASFVATSLHRAESTAYKKWVSYRAGAKFGIAEVEMLGLRINKLRLTRGPDGLWVAVPSLKGTDQHRNIPLDINGKARDTRERFQAQVRAVLRAQHRGLFQGQPAQ
jgi:DNA-binding cell septation regulator SpoVG